MSKSDLKFVLVSFTIWRVLLSVFVYLSLSSFIPRFGFLGGGFHNYAQKPHFLAWANFDGEFYLSIAQNGYGHLQHAFFPLYPILMRYLSKIIGGGLISVNWAGLLVANLSFFIALIGLIKLIRIDFKKEIAYFTVILLLLFPASFFFGSVYSESLFLALTVWSFYFVRKGKWWKGGLLGALSAATRFVGIFLVPSYIAEFWQQKRKIISRDFIAIFIIPMGFFAYMYFLNQTTGSPLAFINELPGFGEQRQISPVLLPQVFYRYIFKIFPAINYDYLPVVFSTVLEFLVAISFLVLTVLAYFKLRLSYAIYLTGVYLLPTLTGSFSSLPRYVLLAFPAFILLSLYIQKLPRLVQAIVMVLLLVCLLLATSLFARGYWIA